MYNEHLRFGKINELSLKKTINIQNGFFDSWMEENKFKIPDKECLKEAYHKSIIFNDGMLKKRAAAAKCFYKISMNRKKEKI